VLDLLYLHMSFMVLSWANVGEEPETVGVLVPVRVLDANGHTNKASDRSIDAESTKDMPPCVALTKYPQPIRHAVVLSPPCDSVTEYVIQVPSRVSGGQICDLDRPVPEQQPLSDVMLHQHEQSVEPPEPGS